MTESPILRAFPQKKWWDKVDNLQKFKDPEHLYGVIACQIIDR